MAHYHPKNLYQSVPLLEASSVRLVKVLPQTSDDDAIHCSINSVALDSKPQYVALSYTWGAPTRQAAERGMTNQRRFPITCNGQELHVTENLLHFLRRIARDEFGTRPHYWIDSICIDQDNFQERNDQVLMMPIIYANAEVVCIWLGELDEFTIPALELIAFLGTMGINEIR